MGHLVPGTRQVFLCITYLARTGGGHLVPGTCQVFFVNYIFSEDRWWPPGLWDLSGLFVCYVFSEDRWWPPGPWDLSGLFVLPI